MKRSIILLHAALLASVLPLRAQEASVSAGDRVRVVRADGPAASGTLLRMDTAGVLVRSAPADSSFTPWSNVARLDRSRGRDHLRSGLTAGAIGAVVSGAVAAAAIYHDEPNSECVSSCHAVVSGLAGVVFGVVGGAVGFTGGVLFAPERWGRAQVPVRISVGRGRGVELGARIGF
jgi:hypothetical protein